MDTESLKNLTRRLGLYRQARWLNRVLLNRSELYQEKSDLKFYSGLIGANDLVFDVGANYGQKTKVFLKLGAKVVAFEPQEDCRRELLWRCGTRPNLTIRADALGPQAGKATFFVRESRASSGLVREWESEFESQIEVPVRTLDDSITEFGNPKYIKIDVEGFELEVLKGLSHPVPLVSIEYHVSKRHKNDAEKTRQCIEYLAGLADIEINLTPAEELIFASEKWLSKNAFLELFARLNPDELRRLFPHAKRPKAHGDIFIRTLPT